MSRSRWPTALFALLFLARAFVPVGYMVAPGPQGGLALTLCSGFAPPQAASHGEHHHHEQSGDDGQQDARHDPCPFALAGGAPLAGAASAALATAVAHAAPRSFLQLVLPARPLTGAHGARAPPFAS